MIWEPLWALGIYHITTGSLRDRLWKELLKILPLESGVTWNPEPPHSPFVILALGIQGPAWYLDLKPRIVGCLDPSGYPRSPIKALCEKSPWKAVKQRWPHT